mgnify:CR=1 FL=1
MIVIASTVNVFLNLEVAEPIPLLAIARLTVDPSVGCLKYLSLLSPMMAIGIPESPFAELLAKNVQSLMKTFVKRDPITSPA